MPRRAKGQSIIEFAIATTVLIPVGFLFIDAIMIACAVQVNDRTCSEAARLASAGDPALTFARAQQIVAQTVIEKHSPYALRLIAAETTVKDSQLAALSPYGGQVSGTVKVTTEIAIKPLVLSWLTGSRLDQLRFQTNQSFPCTYMVPNVLECTKL